MAKKTNKKDIFTKKTENAMDQLMETMGDELLKSDKKKADQVKNSLNKLLDRKGIKLTSENLKLLAFGMELVIGAPDKQMGVIMMLIARGIAKDLSK